MSMAKISQCINEIQGTMQSEGRKERKIKESKKEKHNGSIRYVSVLICTHVHLEYKHDYALYIHVQLCQFFMVSMYETATCKFKASIGICTILQSILCYQGVR